MATQRGARPGPRLASYRASIHTVLGSRTYGQGYCHQVGAVSYAKPRRCGLPHEGWRTKRCLQRTARLQPRRCYSPAPYLPPVLQYGFACHCCLPRNHYLPGTFYLLLQRTLPAFNATRHLLLCARFSISLPPPSPARGTVAGTPTTTTRRSVGGTRTYCSGNGHGVTRTHTRRDTRAVAAGCFRATLAGRVDTAYERLSTVTVTVGTTLTWLLARSGFVCMRGCILLLVRAGNTIVCRGWRCARRALSPCGDNRMTFGIVPCDLPNNALCDCTLCLDHRRRRFAEHRLPTPYRRVRDIHRFHPSNISHLLPPPPRRLLFDNPVLPHSDTWFVHRRRDLRRRVPT